MAGDIQYLLDVKIQKEREMRVTEIKMLQSQINPHFLYNTLNTIKWMATIQGSEGIKEIAVCLGRILKSALDNTQDKISIREELGIINDYIRIQSLKYKEKIHFSIEVQDDSLLEYSIIKFILQPVIENAIFHGIEPKEGIGRIEMSIRKENERIYIEVCDNGVGISEEKLGTILKRTDDGNNSMSDGIALNNINKRIKLVYGENYGLTLASELGFYTRVIMEFPAELTDMVSLPDEVI